MAEKKVTKGQLVKVAEWLTKVSLDGVGPLSSSKNLAQEYLMDHDYKNNEARVKALIKWESAKNFGTGFLTGLGGFITLPVSLPSGMVAAWAVQARMVGAIAEIYGHSLDESRVQTAILLCLVESDIAAVLSEAGCKIGEKVSLKLIDKIPVKVIQKINELVGFRLVTKAGSTGIVNLAKMAPFIGGAVSGGVDALSCAAVGKCAMKMFRPQIG